MFCLRYVLCLLLRVDVFCYELSVFVIQYRLRCRIYTIKVNNFFIKIIYTERLFEPSFVVSRELLILRNFPFFFLVQ